MGISRMTAARLLLGLAFLGSLISMLQTVSHLTDPEYYLPALSDGPQHARFHFVREVAGDFGKIIAAVIILSVPATRRTPILWWLLFVLVLSYYGGFWAGYPILGVGAPNLPSQIVHTLTTVLGLAGVWVARSCFQPTPGMVREPKP
jgi:hypothetical protein